MQDMVALKWETNDLFNVNVSIFYMFHWTLIQMCEPDV